MKVMALMLLGTDGGGHDVARVVVVMVLLVVVVVSFLEFDPNLRSQGYETLKVGRFIFPENSSAYQNVAYYNTLPNHASKVNTMLASFNCSLIQETVCSSEI